MTSKARLNWKRNANEAFIDGKYSRVHTWTFDGGTELKASSSPEIVPIPMSDPSAADPEESFIASLAACHMLFFLSMAAKKKYTVDSYEDDPEGTLGQTSSGKMAMVHVVLRPRVSFANSTIPSKQQLDDLHRLAHEQCFLANSLNTKIEIISQ